MALEISRQTIEIETGVGGGIAQTLARAETLVPGAGREAIEVLLADAMVAIESVEAQTDRGRGGHGALSGRIPSG